MRLNCRNFGDVHENISFRDSFSVDDHSFLTYEDLNSVSYVLGHDTQIAYGNVSSLGNRHETLRMVEGKDEVNDGLTRDVVLYMRLNLSTDTTPSGNTLVDKPMGL